MQILTIQTKFEAFECKFEPFERDWNANSNHSNSKRIRNIGMQILTIQIQNGFETFECKFEQLQ